MSRANIQPILEAIPAARQEDARHYGVHPYFTRRPANVVREYLKRYSQEGDVVLDPFGGTGVTAIESFLLGCRCAGCEKAEKDCQGAGFHCGQFLFDSLSCFRSKIKVEAHR